MYIDVNKINILSTYTKYYNIPVVNVEISVGWNECSRYVLFFNWLNCKQSFGIYFDVNILDKPNVTVPGTITETATTITIDCTASVTQNSPTITAVYWLLNGKNLNLSDSAKYSVGIMNTPSLTIKNIASTDAGEYRCGATNLVGSTTSSQSVNLGKSS